MPVTEPNQYPAIIWAGTLGQMIKQPVRTNLLDTGVPVQSMVYISHMVFDLLMSTSAYN